MLTRRVAYDDGALRITRTGKPAVLAMAGEIDESAYAGLVKTLRRLTAGQRDIHISLRDVAFCDLAGLRAMIALTGACDGADESGGRPPGACQPGSHQPGSHQPATARLVLHDVPSHLLTVLQVLGWDHTPGLVISAPASHLWQAFCDPAPAAGKQPGRRTLAFAHPTMPRRSASARSGRDRRATQDFAGSG